eukprot:TRINITY_DN8726_c0_g1_i1.p1 TRINITY_DN8726_c0_g1~~TRINITY_DN8726_c0_g1_i1.p1  ORF type:complete len:271 (-),score=37.97 TRINITY_DN8726_c0_g1_i1:144-956(-)
MQYEYQTGTWLPAIRTLALYTNARHYPSRNSEVLVLDRPHECVLMCAIQLFLEAIEAGRPPETVEEVTARTAVADRPELPSSRWKEGRLRVAETSHYPLRFLTRQMTDRKFGTFATFRAVVLWPYDMDLVCFYEFYSMGMPIFMPSYLPRYIFFQHHMEYEGRSPDAASLAERRGRIEADSLWQDEWGSPFNESSLEAVRNTVKFTDYFRYPAVQRFQSIAELLEGVTTTDFAKVVESMGQFQAEVTVEALSAWRAVFRRVGDLTNLEPE